MYYFWKEGFYNKHHQSQLLRVALMKCSKECIIFSWVNVILMKAISFMVCISLWKNSSVCIFYHSALLKWLSPETGFQDEWRSEFACMKVMVFVERNWPLSLWAPRKHRDPKLYIFQHKGYEAILSTRLSEKYSFTAFFFVFSLQCLWITFPWVLAPEGFSQISLCQMFGLFNENPFLALK